MFSGSLTNAMHDMLVAMPDFEPLDILVSQIDRSAITKVIEWKKEGFCRWLFIDSGAFSIHTGNATTTADEYIEYLNSIDEYIDVFAQLDKIPGTFQQPKTPEDYVESARLSWENFLKFPCTFVTTGYPGLSMNACINFFGSKSAYGFKLAHKSSPTVFLYLNFSK